MSRFIVDTNVVSEIWKPAPDAKVDAWVRRSDFSIPSVVVAEWVRDRKAALWGRPLVCRLNGSLTHRIRISPEPIYGVRDSVNWQVRDLPHRATFLSRTLAELQDGIEANPSLAQRTRLNGLLDRLVHSKGAA
jgi:hypothetical protein